MRTSGWSVALPVESGPIGHTFSGDEALAYVRSRHLKSVDANGNQNEDRAGDLGRISRQQDFLRRVLQAALQKGIFDPAVASALIDSLQTYIVRDAGMTIDDILSFAGVMRDINPLAIRTYQVESYGKVVGGVAVQIPKLKTDNMQAILALFLGTAPLAGAPDQVLTTTTIAASPATTTVGTVLGEPDEDGQLGLGVAVARLQEAQDDRLARKGVQRDGLVAEVMEAGACRPSGDHLGRNPGRPR